MVADAYDKRKAANNQSVPLSSVSDADAKAFLDRQGNEQKFKEFVENQKLLGSIPKDKQPTDKEIAEAKLNWAKIEVAYERAMAEKANLSEKQRRKIELQLKLQKAQYLAQQYNKDVLIPKLAATTEEIEDFKKQHPEFDTKGKKAKAEEILQRAKNGEDFAKLANEFTEDPGAKNKGGLYVNVKKGDFVPAFEQAALALEPGQIADSTVETQFGYHIIKLVRKGDTYDVRHILISTMISDPANPASAPMPANDLAKTRIEADKEKKLSDELIAKHKITVAEDFKVPQNSK